MKSAPPRKEARSHYFSLVAKAATYGITEVHPASHLFPMHGCKGNAWLGWQPQGLAASRFGQNLPQTGLSVFSPKNLAAACHTLNKHPVTETSD